MWRFGSLNRVFGFTVFIAFINDPREEARYKRRSCYLHVRVNVKTKCCCSIPTKAWQSAITKRIQT
jgi:hypothetical protein